MTSRSLKAQRRREGGDISMFPFLAVLICTMGALILLLIIITHHAAAQSKREAVQQHTQRKTDLAEQREDAAWRSEILKNSLRKTREKLAELRQTLGYLESDTTRLRSEVIELAQALKRLEDQQPSPENSAKLEERLARLQDKIVVVRQNLEEKMRATARKARSYAVVPYFGPNQTRRYPIYVECRSEGVVLQPEGILLGESDFIGFFGPDNPLAAALRAKASYLQQRYQFDRQGGFPYPLLLVRQSGIESYSAAMEAMQSWDSEFGYELIEDDMELDFTEPDPRLRQIVHREIEYARSKRQALAEAVPRLYNDPVLVRSGGGGSGGGRQYYTVSSGQGGIVPYHGDVEDLEPVRSKHYGSTEPSGYPSDLGQNETRGTGTVEASYPPVTRRDSPSNLLGSDLERSDQGRYDQGGYDQGSYDQGGYGQGSQGQSADGQAGFEPNKIRGRGDVPYDSRSSLAGSQPTTTHQAFPGVLGAVSSQDEPRLLSPPGTDARGAANLYGHDNSSGGTSCSGGGSTPSLGSQAASSSPTAGQTAQAPLGIGEWQPTSGNPNDGAMDEPRKPDPFAPAQRHRSSKRPESIADVRGKNWCLPKEAAYHVPLSRPIAIECHADRFVFRPIRGSLGQTTVPLSGQTADSVNEFVSSVWDRIESWGMAGQGMYWRPILSMHVYPGGESRFADLQALFRESGFVVEEKK